ncbi:MAG: DUF885 family protein [Deltaproteobacteria bacterium]|nr:DUF885 family protein [Deltaproteobacteria bacterium]
MAEGEEGQVGAAATTSRRARALAEELFEAHVDDHPEEASTLGLWHYADRWSDPSRAAQERELARLRPRLTEVESLLASTDGLDLDARLDLDAAARLARHRIRWIENDRDASQLEVATLPNSVMQHAALHARSTDDARRLALRARATPAFLDRCLDNLRRGARDGRGPDATCLAAMVERVMPGAAASCEALPSIVAARVGTGAGATLSALAEASRVAADAYRAFARALTEEIAPRARREVSLGEEEVAFRLRDVMGIDAPIADLLGFARQSLAAARADLVERVRRFGHPEVRTPDDARDVLMAVLAAKPSTIEEALARYRLHTRNAVRLIEERSLLPLPKPLELTLTPVPGGVADGTTLTNWPAPLLDPAGHGHALYSTDPASHGIVQSKNLSVHEGIPGHYLQSVVWQRGKRSPIRFLGITDDIAASRAYFGTMMSVEGWAVHVEHLFREEGFYDDGAEAIFEAFVAAIHAARVVNDLEVHAGGMGDDAATDAFARATLMPERWARMQVLRSRRIPLQHLTYLLGAHEIESLRAKALAAGVSRSELYGRLLEHGPVPPSRLVDAFTS